MESGLTRPSGTRWGANDHRMRMLRKGTHNGSKLHTGWTTCDQVPLLPEWEEQLKQLDQIKAQSPEKETPEETPESP